MSHRRSCPSDWDARHEGERAFEYGSSRSSNPYEGNSWNRDRACREAEEEWDRGYRRAEIRDEERREEEAAHRRADMRRQEAQAEEDEYYAYQQEQYAEQDARELVEIAASPSADDDLPF